MRDQEFYEWELRQYESRRRTRNERKRRKSETALRLAVAAWAVLMAAILATGARSAELEDNNSPSPKDAPEAQEMPIAEIEEEPVSFPTIEGVKLTHYCICKKCCGKSPDHEAYGITASGRAAEPYKTVAVDPKVIPLGSTVYVDYGDGVREYRADDTGGAIKGARIDLCVSDHQEANELGVKIVKVWWSE